MENSVNTMRLTVALTSLILCIYSTRHHPIVSRNIGTKGKFILKNYQLAEVTVAGVNPTQTAGNVSYLTYSFRPGDSASPISEVCNNVKGKTALLPKSGFIDDYAHCTTKGTTDPTEECLDLMELQLAYTDVVLYLSVIIFVFLFVARGRIVDGFVIAMALTVLLLTSVTVGQADSMLKDGGCVYKLADFSGAAGEFEYHFGYNHVWVVLGLSVIVLVSSIYSLARSFMKNDHAVWLGASNLMSSSATGATTFASAYF